MRSGKLGVKMRKTRYEDVKEWCSIFDNMFKDFLGELPEEERFDGQGRHWMRLLEQIQKEPNRIKRSRKSQALNIIHTKYFWKHNPNAQFFAKELPEAIEYFIKESLKESVKGVKK